MDFGGKPARTSLTDTATPVKVLTPSAILAGPVPVTLTTVGGTATAPQPYTYIGVPAISSLNPTTAGRRRHGGHDHRDEPDQRLGSPSTAVAGTNWSGKQ